MEYRCDRCENDEYCYARLPADRPTFLHLERENYAESFGLIPPPAAARYCICSEVFAERYMDEVKLAFSLFLPSSLSLSLPVLSIFFSRTISSHVALLQAALASAAASPR